MTEAADRFRYTTIAHAGRALLGPLSVASVDALLARLAPGAPGAPGTPGAAGPTVLDVGCGKGEILVRASLRLGADGTGVDPNAAFVADARARARAAGIDERVVLHATTLADAPLAGAVFDLVICTGATHAFGDWPTALAAMAARTRPGGQALVGVGYWRCAPAAEYLAAFAGSADELAPLADTLATARAAGWRVLAAHESTHAEWDEYEHGYAGALLRWLAQHPNDPEAPAFHARMESWSAAYERWGRETMGFVTLVLARP